MNITPEIFEQQCKRRFGTKNPERMQIAHWEWMVRHGKDPFVVREQFGLGHDMETPDWCFDRFGMSRTAMPDGRIICIGGEHEDSYDPDFCIYNDVIVLRPAASNTEVTLESGDVGIYGYPESIFPPTDFHSATPVADTIYLIGRLGYFGTRIRDVTPVFKVDTKTYRIEEVKTTGQSPGWIYQHYAAYDAHLHAITVFAGKRHDGDEAPETPSGSSHRLFLEDMHWEPVSDRLEIRRYELEAIALYADDPAPENFRPKSVPHTWLPPEKPVYPKYRIDVAGVCVRFDCFTGSVDVSIEGNLQQNLVDRVLKEVMENLAASTGTEWKMEVISTE